MIRLFTLTSGVADLPSDLDGIPVEIVVTGRITALSHPDDIARYRPAHTGNSVGHPAITAGTIGAKVTDGVNSYILSNNHVLADVNEANIGDAIIQPGSFDGGSSPADDIGTLADFEPLSFKKNTTNTIDAAIALLPSASDVSNTTHDGTYTLSTNTVTAFVGQNVKKTGRTTGLTSGQVAEINVTVDVCYKPKGLFGCAGNGIATFIDQISVTPGTFSDGGDSGSFMVTDDANNDAVGLLFAGSPSRTLANPIGDVLTRFGVTVGDPQPVTDIAIDSVSAPSSATLGDLVSVDVTVANSGNQDVTSDIEVTLVDDTDGGTIDTQTITGGLDAGISTTLNYSWDTTASSLGPHTLTASHGFADDNAGNDSNSTTVTVNEPGATVTVTSIFPATGARGTTVDVTVSGNNFEAGATLTFDNGKGKPPTVSNVMVVDSTTITAEITISSKAKVGIFWDVTVTNTDGGSGTLLGGFEVT